MASESRVLSWHVSPLNTFRPRQNGHHFIDDIFKCIFLKENARLSFKISPKSVPKVRITNIPALVQIMAWRRPGDKPLYEPMMVSLLTHICVTRPHWINSWRPCDAYIRQIMALSSVQVKVFPQFRVQRIPYQTLIYCHPQKQFSVNIISVSDNCFNWKCKMMVVFYT